MIAHACVAVLAAALVALVYYVCVRTAPGQSADTLAMRGADVHHPRIEQILRRALDATSLVSLVAVSLAAAAIGIVRRRADLTIAAAVLVLGANVTTQLLKTRLPRPDLDNFPAPNSFPSGHTTAAASVAFALILVLPFAIRGTVALAGAAYVTTIAVATIWAEWHRPSDTAAALLIVLAWSALASALVRARRVRITGVAARPNRKALLLFSVVGALGTGCAALGLGATVLSELAAPDLVPGRLAFAAGVAAVTATVAGVFAIWVRLAAGDRPSAPNAVVPASARSAAPPR
ncbi:phosphatase PAP2 family protein [Actinoplanes sp. NPDC051346]|uniref:phosphatase PAP2 family protein n=1 Tax=Actinoplanes sp. NPDC051346 TaxID=3155048 RepID=UPI003416D72F